MLKTRSFSPETLFSWHKPFGNDTTPVSVTPKPVFHRKKNNFRVRRNARNIKAISPILTPTPTTTPVETRTPQKVTAVVTVQKPGFLTNIRWSKVQDDLTEVFGRTLLLEFFSAELDPETGSEKETIKGYARRAGQDEDDNVKYEFAFVLPSEFGDIGAVRVVNEIHIEMYFKNIKVLDSSNGDVCLNMSCNSWVQSKFVSPEKRTFFTNKSYLPFETPSGLNKLRQDDLKAVRGNGEGERKSSERIYDYDVYNDIGDPDSPDTVRPVLGGNEHPYPRRCRTGRPKSTNDLSSETRSSSNYVPRDEAFSAVKQRTFYRKTAYSVLQVLLPILLREIRNGDVGFPNFTAIDTLYEQEDTEFTVQSNGIIGYLLIQLAKIILRFDIPEVVKRDYFSWFTDEEFSRETLAGLNPCSLQLVTDWPLRSKLDPEIYGSPESLITKKLVEQEIGGFMTLEEVMQNPSCIRSSQQGGGAEEEVTAGIRGGVGAATMMWQRRLGGGGRGGLDQGCDGGKREATVVVEGRVGEIRGLVVSGEADGLYMDGGGGGLQKAEGCDDEGVRQLGRNCRVEFYNQSLPRNMPQDLIRYFHHGHRLKRSNILNMQALEKKKLFMLDYNDLLLPYVNEIRELEGTTLYGSRTLFFLTEKGTLRPLAIELTRPPGNGKPQWKHVYRPCTDATGSWLWKLAKAQVLAQESGYHQLVSHWLRTHCAMEPYIIATNRQLSTMHPIYRLLHPHCRFTMEINALARQSLINAGGIIESSFSPGKYSMQLSSAVYELQWRFDQQALPADLIARGMAQEDPTSPHNLKLTIEDYPFANDGLILWDAINEWVTDYVKHYYPNESLVKSDQELHAWWKEIRTVGHEDKKEGWPTLKTPEDLIGILTTIIWVASGHHSAVNFGQYAYAGYFPNRPTIARNKMPNEDPSDEEWTSFLENPDGELLKCYPSQIQATQVMAVLDILSNHSPDEEYIGANISPSWEENLYIKSAFEVFKAKIELLGNTIDERNEDNSLKNRFGAGVVPYELLKPMSEKGVTGMGVPNSISI
ncbi:hypothetical protein RJ640_026354 [Escallonia rubra]|uniref:Lipoxygenase n=1 Tax=Escallonia rubra TaxID=112253 RepID=A0AA88RN15_9ASTE|nr:hypothetical protein RJ640_026354 [Escallonia rubra]